MMPQALKSRYLTSKECGFINVEIFALLTKWGEALA
jgi:hypothetical protein